MEVPLAGRRIQSGCLVRNITSQQSTSSGVVSGLQEGQQYTVSAVYHSLLEDRHSMLYLDTALTATTSVYSICLFYIS